MINNKNQWKPLKGSLILKERTKDMLVYIKEDNRIWLLFISQEREEKDKILFCEECGLYNKRRDWGEETALWIEAPWDKYMEVCLFCKQDKVKHMCERDSHVTCMNLMNFHAAVAEKQQSPQQPGFVLKWKYFIRTLFVLLAISLIYMCALTLNKVYIGDKLVIPLITTSSHELQDVIKEIRK